MPHLRIFLTAYDTRSTLWRVVPGRKSAISRRLDASCYGVKYLRRTHDRVGDDTLRATITRHRGYTVKRFHALMRQMERAKCSLIIGRSGREYTKSDNYRHNFSLAVNRYCLHYPIGRAGVARVSGLLSRHIAHRDKPS